MTWRSLPTDEAKAHPLYGNRGWLGALLGAFILFAVILFFAGLSLWTDPMSAFRTDASLALDKLYMGMTFSTFALGAFSMIRKWRYTPELIAVLFLASLLIGMVSTLQTAHYGALLNLGLELLLDGLVLGYLFFARRPNMTFRHRMRQAGM